MTIHELRQRFLSFFKEKGHAIIPSASLMPENDPSVLFTTAGMQPLVPYLKGETHPMGTRIANAQKCLRTGDIDDVGDNRHLTFFEMLGNWSLGDYFKQESIGWSFEFLTDPRWLGIDPKKLYVTAFIGDEDAPRDEESVAYWQAQFEVHGIEAHVGEAFKAEPASGAVGTRIFLYGKKQNWWPGPLSKGLCGPDTEIYYDTGIVHDPVFGDVCHPDCDCGRFVEIWNNVFMQFSRPEEGAPLEPLPKKNVDTGMGLERATAVLSGFTNVFDLDIFQVLFRGMESLGAPPYGSSPDVTRSMRIIADHIRSATFAIGDGIIPSNLKQGYVIRRLIRRAIREGHRLGITQAFCAPIAAIVIGTFGLTYRELETQRDRIIDELSREEAKFQQTIDRGMKELEKMLNNGTVNGEQAFLLYSTYGFPIELTEEIIREKGMQIDRTVFIREFEKHRDLSRTASSGMFKGGLADDSYETTKLHTATHLLHAALRKVLGDHVEQKGSNITNERLRFDFSHPEKMSEEQIREVERLVNETIDRDVEVSCSDMSVDDARHSGALGFFEEKYRDIGGKIKVYQVGDNDSFFSKEICGGPHVQRTGELGRFKIQKEEASSAGVRRIKATLFAD